MNTTLHHQLPARTILCDKSHWQSLYNPSSAYSHSLLHRFQPKPFRFVATTDLSATLLTFTPFPVCAVIRPTSLPWFPIRVREGFSGFRACPVPSCHRYHSVEVAYRFGQCFVTPCCLRPELTGSTLEMHAFEAIYAFTLVTA